jgi:6-phosphogluconolactonase
MEVNIFSGPAEVARAAAQHFVEQSQRAVAQSNGFAVALSGGSTPKLLYALLADPKESFRERIAWDKSHFLFTDERHVPPDHPESNYRMVNEAMFSHAPKTHLYRIPSEKPAAEAAEEYEDTLAELFGADVPDLDLVLLGLGEDGHTASLFPHSPALKETERLVLAPWVEKLNAHRITLTLPVLNNGNSVVFLVTGASKAEILREVIKTDPNPDLYPAQAVRPIRGELLWFVDEAAARLIK